jgi:MFS family permease
VQVFTVGARAVRERSTQYGAALAVPAVRRLWLAHAVSEMGDWAARLALSVLAFHTGAGALGAAGVWIASTLPYLGMGQVLATLADRFPHRQVVLVTNLVRAVLFALLAVVHLPVWGVLLVALAAALADPPYEAAVASAVPQLAGGAYGASQALFSATAQLSVLVGYGVGGLLLAAVGAQAALALNAVSFALNGLVLFGLPATRAAADDGTARTTRAYLREGAGALWRDPLVRWAVLLVNASAVSGMAVEATVVAYAVHLGHGDGTATGLLALAVPVAALVASGLWPNTGTPERLVRVLAWGTVGLTGAAALGYLADLPLPGALLPLLLFGAMEVSMVPAVAVVMPRLPQATRGSSVGFLQGSLRTLQMVGAAAGGALAVVLGVPLAMALLAVPSVAVGLAALVAVRRTPATPAVRVGGRVAVTGEEPPLQA